MHSFDVFDTLITRITDKPSDIFDLMQSNICQNMDKYKNFSVRIKESFARLRVEAEDLAYKFYDADVVGLEDIYYAFSMMTGISNEECKELKELEIEFELKNSEPIQENIDCVKKLVLSGEKVVLISDMYLPSQVIRKILMKYDMIFETIPLYVSCESGSTKSSGLLYILIHEKERVSYTEWIHIGDNGFSDVCIPNMLGIVTKPYKRKEDDENYKVGYKVGGTILYPYVKWIINTCITMGVSRVYFIARDGYVLKKIADLIINAKDYRIKTQYLYFSRDVICSDKETALEGYMRQEIDVGENDFALVDLQGRGETLEKLAGIMKCRFDVFYYYLMESDYKRRNRYHIFAAKSKGNIIETLCRAPHGITTGYEFVNEVWQPVLSKDYSSCDYECQIEEYTKGVCAFTKKTIFLEKQNDISMDYRNQSKELLDRCYENPSKREADYIGEIFHGNSNEVGVKFAPLIDEEVINKYYYNSEVYNGLYFDYSLKRLSREQRYKAEIYKKEFLESLGRYICGEYFQNKKNIVLYGAGKNAWKKVVKYGKNSDINIVAWTDVNYKKYQKQEMPVVSFADAIKKNYDYIVITIESRRVIKQVKELLVEVGVVRDRIVSVEEFELLNE